MQRHHCFHVEVILAAAQLQLLSHCIHECTFPQLYPVAKAVLGNLHSVGLVGLDLAVGITSALFEEQLAARQSLCFPFGNIVPAAFILFLLVIGYGFPLFTHCLFNLLIETSAHGGSTYTNRMLSSQQIPK